MKRKIFTFLLVLGVAWSLHSCDNNDDESIAVPVELQSTFSAKYPNATNVEWENKYGYYVADFYDGHEASAWFTQEGKCGVRGIHSSQLDRKSTRLNSSH